ncbi:MAG: choice-of-anchor tandem repeat GloVer-containing protein [Candidatus Cybelea sp.]
MRIIALLLSIVLASCSRAFSALPAESTSGISPLAPGSPMAASFKTLYIFGGGTDGIEPEAPLIKAGSELYGTTALGGSRDNGSVFAIDESGKERVLYGFEGGKDGSEPLAGLLELNGKLYGTTRSGGHGASGGNGTVFELNLAGTERVLHRFDGGTDGAYPYGGLIAVNGTLYGTTYAGGTGDNGTVFSVSTSGKERIIYRFTNTPDGRGPLAGLIVASGALYGTTAGGGRHTGGTVFEVSTSGDERVLYSFKGGRDGEIPSAAVTVVNGVFYGTTVYGGTPGSANYGTVFEVNDSGKERVVYRFQGGTDGISPFGSVVAVGGMLYGTTYFGGYGSSGRGIGTIFEVSTSGKELVLHRFMGGADGGNPAAGLLVAGGAFYGTTSQAGLSGPNGDGTIFRI